MLNEHARVRERRAGLPGARRRAGRAVQLTPHGLFRVAAARSLGRDDGGRILVDARLTPPIRTRSKPSERGWPRCCGAGLRLHRLLGRRGLGLPRLRRRRGPRSRSRARGDRPERILSGRAARMALECVRRFGIPHLEIETDELADPRYAANPTNRCYYCKTDCGAACGRSRPSADSPRCWTAPTRTTRATGGRAWPPRLSTACARRSSRSGSPSARSGRSPRRWACRPGTSRPPLPGQPAALRPGRHARAAPRSGTRGGCGSRPRLPRVPRPSPRRRRAPRDRARGVSRALKLASVLAANVRAAGFARVLLDVQGYRRGALNEGLPVLRAG